MHLFWKRNPFFLPTHQGWGILKLINLSLLGRNKLIDLQVIRIFAMRNLHTHIHTQDFLYITYNNATLIFFSFRECSSYVAAWRHNNKLNYLCRCELQHKNQEKVRRSDEKLHVAKFTSSRLVRAENSPTSDVVKQPQVWVARRPTVRVSRNGERDPTSCKYIPGYYSWWFIYYSEEKNEVTQTHAHSFLCPGVSRVSY